MSVILRARKLSMGGFMTKKEVEGDQETVQNKTPVKIEGDKL